MLDISGNLRSAVQLPEGEDRNEWIAVNTVDFFNQINMLYGTITEFCTEDRCAIMSAGRPTTFPFFRQNFRENGPISKISILFPNTQ